MSFALFALNRLKKQPYQSFQYYKSAELLLAVPYVALAKYGAEEGTRTPTHVTGLDPEPSASANSATSAIKNIPILRALGASVNR